MITFGGFQPTVCVLFNGILEKIGDNAVYEI
ncbi:hypothetical protein GDO81_007855 [Engystomops pustulosus]|uniref:Uncharacterized protein n=1 Tax=Engystomops pustulosus TaxID=76066 RepID=A0AAV7CB91_ENGPU|nr:hypothetical protein GDO81_007855 [Engystomops pustulosus]